MRRVEIRIVNLGSPFAVIRFGFFTFGAIFVVTGSLLMPIILHIVLDVAGGWAGWQLEARVKKQEEEAQPAAG